MSNFLNNAMYAIKLHKWFAANLLKVRFPVLFANFWLSADSERRDDPKSAKDKFSIKYEQVRDYFLNSINDNVKSAYDFAVSSVFGKTMRRTANLSVRLIQAMQSKDPFAISSYFEVGALFVAIVFGATAQGYLMKRDKQIIKKAKIIDEIREMFLQADKDKIVDVTRYDPEIIKALQDMQKEPETLKKLPRVFDDQSGRNIFIKTYDVVVNNASMRALARLAVKFWAEDLVYEKDSKFGYWSYHIYGFGYSLGWSAGTHAIHQLEQYEQKVANFEKHFGLTNKRDLQNLLLATQDHASKKPVGNESLKMKKPKEQCSKSTLLKYAKAVFRDDLGVPTSKLQTYESYLEKLLNEGKTNSRKTAAVQAIG